MLQTLKRLFSRNNVNTLPQRVFVIYGRAGESDLDLSEELDSFDPPFFPSDKVDKFSPEEFGAMARVFRRADDAVDHLYRCTQPDMVTCVVYVLDGDRWIQDARATDFFHDNHINY
jgi:hypothetical protein